MPGGSVRDCARKPRNAVSRCAQEGLPVVLHLADRVADIVEREVRGALLEAVESLRRPAPRELLERAHVEVAVMKIPLQRRHLAREKAAVLADAVATHRRDARLDPPRQEVQRLALGLRCGDLALAHAGREAGGAVLAAV